MKKVTPTVSNGKKMWFTNNRTLEERKRDKILGQFKFHLIEKSKFEINDVKINWKKGTVELKHKKVVWVSDDGKFQVADEAEDVQTEVETHMAEWWSRKKGTE